MERIRGIQHMLFSIAQGEFGFRIPRSMEDDEIEGVIVLLNMMAEEMRETLQAYNDLRVRASTEDYLQLLMILDVEFRMVYVSPDFLKELGHDREDLEKEFFSQLISPSQLELWTSLAAHLQKEEEYSGRHRFLLKCQNKLERQYDCSILAMNGTGVRFYSISNNWTVSKSRLLEDGIRKEEALLADEPKKPPRVLTRAKDRQIIRAIHDHILENLEHPLPSLQKLANNFGTNEFKLKYGFKELYGITVFRFLKRERMKKGRLLLENTTLTVKAIAQICGYSRASHFSRDFKEEYGVRPLGVRPLG